MTKTNKCKTCSQAAKNSREVTGTPNGQEQTDAKDPEKPPKIEALVPCQGHLMSILWHNSSLYLDMAKN